MILWRSRSSMHWEWTRKNVSLTKTADCEDAEEKSERDCLWTADESAGTCRGAGRRCPRGWRRLGLHRRIRTAIHRFGLDQPQVLADVGLELLAKIGVVLEKLLGVFTTLAD